MPLTVSAQAYVFLSSVLGGMAIAFIYDLFRVKRKAVKTWGFLVQVEDIFFWILVSLVMFGMVYYSNDGELRGYIFMGALIGVILYMLILSRAVMNSSLFIIRIIARVFKFLWMVFSFPFKILFRLFSYPLGFVSGLTRKGVRKLRNIGRTRLVKARQWRKAFKNARNKI